ncbi:MAG: winged helix-turn-helix domain-containing protein [Trebonia sp.]
MTGTDRPRREHRRIADMPSLRALTHPTRLTLLEAIGLAGTLTATQASAATNESPTACAYHLRMLGRLGFIEEAGGGRGRERPWRLAQKGITVAVDEADTAALTAAEALGAAFTERLIARIRAYQTSRNRYPEEVRAATGVFQSIVFATPEEFSQLRERIAALISPFIERIDPALRPPGGQPFEIALFSHVFDVPGGGQAPGADDEKTIPDP